MIIQRWGLIYKTSYDNLKMMPKLRLTYDKRLILENILRRTQDFSRFTCNIVRLSEIAFVH